MTLARWSGDAYLLTSQKLLQDQYEREFGAELQIVKGRDNYTCDHYPGARVPTGADAGVVRRAAPAPPLGRRLPPAHDRAPRAARGAARSDRARARGAPAPPPPGPRLL